MLLLQSNSHPSGWVTGGFPARGDNLVAGGVSVILSESEVAHPLQIQIQIVAFEMKLKCPFNLTKPKAFAVKRV